MSQYFKGTATQGRNFTYKKKAPDNWNRRTNSLVQLYILSRKNRNPSLFLLGSWDHTSKLLVLGSGITRVNPQIRITGTAGVNNQIQNLCSMNLKRGLHGGETESP
jgi:hypothetical protein